MRPPSGRNGVVKKEAFFKPQKVAKREVEMYTVVKRMMDVVLSGIALLVLSPLLVPIALHFGWDLVWFGVIITMNMALGQFHPPLGVNLMVTCRLAAVPMESTISWVLWMVLAMAGTMFLVTCVPDLALWLPRSLGYL